MSNIVKSRAGVGAALGGIVGFMFGGPVPAAVGALVGGGIAHASGDTQKGVMTPRRRVIFENAIKTVKDPRELKKLAVAFHGEGLRAEAVLLEKRAKLRSLPEQTQEVRRGAFRKAMASDSPDAIIELASAFEEAGSLDAAKVLRDHAEAVREAHLAGKSAKPMTGGSQADFADKLSKALKHFGPTSKQAQTAAKNLVQARGKVPTDALVQEVIKLAMTALKPVKAASDTIPSPSPDAPAPTQAPTEAPAEAPAEAPVEAPVEPVEPPPQVAMADAPPSTAVENIEPMVVGDGVTSDGMTPQEIAHAAAAAHGDVIEAHVVEVAPAEAEEGGE